MCNIIPRRTKYNWFLWTFEQTGNFIRHTHVVVIEVFFVLLFHSGSRENNKTFYAWTSTQTSCVDRIYHWRLKFSKDKLSRSLVRVPIPDKQFKLAFMHKDQVQITWTKLSPSSLWSMKLLILLCSILQTFAQRDAYPGCQLYCGTSLECSTSMNMCRT